MNRVQKLYNYYNWGGRFFQDPFMIEGEIFNNLEISKRPFRFDVINFLLNQFQRNTVYLEIGVRNPNDNFNKIISNVKYSVDPGVEFKDNPVDFQVTSDDFFNGVRDGFFLKTDILFDVIFIDGLHLAEQVNRDIENALQFLKEDGFIVLHDCNPPSEFHARESYQYTISPAKSAWNGTTWKAFFKARFKENVFSCCIDTDWGVGVLSKKVILGSKPSSTNDFYEFKVLDEMRQDHLNLISFEEFKIKITQ